MTIERGSIVPTVTGSIEVWDFDRDHVMIHQKEYEYRIKVNLLTKQLFDLIDGKNTISDIVDQFNKKNSVIVDVDVVHKILYGDLARFGIVDSGVEVNKVDTSRYLTIRTMLFSREQVTRISHWLGFLFAPRSFYSVLAVCCSFLVIVYTANFSLASFTNSISPEWIAYVFALNIISLFFHELGHASACRQLGAEHGGIGFGFYLFTPVVFADVSDAWKLSRQKRMIINLAGFYMQCCINVLIVIAYLVTRNVLYLNIGAIFIVGMLFNLNPFFRRDGYWAVSDGLNIPNLKSNSNNALLALGKFLLRKQQHFPIRSRKDLFLVVYGILDWAFIFFILSTILVRDHDSLLYFPVNMWKLLTYLITNFNDLSFVIVKEMVFRLIIPIVFYTMVFNLFIKSFYKRFFK